MWWVPVCYSLHSKGEVLTGEIASTFSTPRCPFGLHAVAQPLAHLLGEAAHILLGRKWFDCAECHRETEDHPLLQKFDMVSALGITTPARSLTVR